MKIIKKFMFFATIVAMIFTSCDTDDITLVPEKKYDNVAYIVNYGSYSGSKSEISIYDTDSLLIADSTGYFSANNVEFTSNIESMSIHNDIAYFMSNNGDKIDIVDAKTLKALGNPISDDITKPRHFVADDNTAYISCWGNVDDWSVMANSYIAKIDLTTKAVTKIALPGGPEGVIIVNNKLYTGLSTDNKVAVVDLATEAISYITVSAVPQQFIEDVDGKIWVSLVSKYSTPFPADSLGLAIIDPLDNTVTDKVDFTIMGSNGFIHTSSDKKIVYALGKDEYPGTASSIHSVDVTTKILNSTALVSGEKFNGFNVNSNNDNIYVLISPSSTENGELKTYNSEGTLLDTEKTLIDPKHVVFYSIEQE